MFTVWKTSLSLSKQIKHYPKLNQNQNQKWINKATQQKSNTVLGQEQEPTNQQIKDRFLQQSRRIYNYQQNHQKPNLYYHIPNQIKRLKKLKVKK